MITLELHALSLQRYNKNWIGNALSRERGLKAFANTEDSNQSAQTLSLLRLFHLVETI